MHGMIDVKTRNDDLVRIPEDATILDFAFYIHSEIGYRCTRAEVNGVEVSLDTQLKDEDSVQIFTAQEQCPKKAWFDIVKTKKARKSLETFDWDYIEAMEHKEKQIQQLETLIEGSIQELETLRSQVKYLHTKILLKKLDDTRSRNYPDEEFDAVYGGMTNPWIELKLKRHEIIKEELATREHVPNKVEAKVIRLNQIKRRNPKNRGGRR